MTGMNDNEAISTSDPFRSIQGVPQRMGIRRARVDHPCSKTEGSGYQIEETSGHYAYVNQLDQIQSLRFPHEDATRRRVGKLLKAVLKTTNQQPIKRHLLLNFHCKAIHSRFAIKVTTSQCRTSTLVATCGKCNTFGKNSITKESIPACCHSWSWMHCHVGSFSELSIMPGASFLKYRIAQHDVLGTPEACFSMSIIQSLQIQLCHIGHALYLHSLHALFLISVQEQSTKKSTEKCWKFFLPRLPKIWWSILKVWTLNLPTSPFSSFPRFLYWLSFKKASQTARSRCGAGTWETQVINEY